MECPRGWVSSEGAPACTNCAGGQHANRAGASACRWCPVHPGVDCVGLGADPPGTTGILTPQNGFWTPDWDAYAAKPWQRNTSVFQCLKKSSCAAANGTLRDAPATAFACVEGSEGALCAACTAPDYFWSSSGLRCLRCDTSHLTDGAKLAIGAALTAAALWVLLKCVARQKALWLGAVLHGARCNMKQRKRQRRRRRRRHRKGGDSDDDEVRRRGLTGGVVIRLGLSAVRAAHAFVKSARRGRFGLGETFRIFVNMAKTVTHLYSTLVFCIHWPQSMQILLDAARMFAFDFMPETRMPCWVTGWSYYSKLWLSAVAPVALTVVFLLYGIVVEACGRRNGRSAARRNLRAAARQNWRRKQARGGTDSCLVAGLWRGAPLVLFCIDLIHPMITRSAKAIAEHCL